MPMWNIACVCVGLRADPLRDSIIHVVMYEHFPMPLETFVVFTIGTTMSRMACIYMSLGHLREIAIPVTSLK